MTKPASYMSIREFSGLCQVSVQAIHKAIKTGRIKRYERIGFAYVIHRAELKAFKLKAGRKI